MMRSRASRPQHFWAELSEEPDPDQDDQHVKASIEPPASATEVHDEFTSSTSQPRRRKPRPHRREQPIGADTCVPDLTDTPRDRQVQQTIQIPSTLDQSVATPPSTCNYWTEASSSDDDFAAKLAKAKRDVAMAELVVLEAERDHDKRSRSSRGSTKQHRDEKAQRIRCPATSALSPPSLLPVMETTTGEVVAVDANASYSSNLGVAATANEPSAGMDTSSKQVHLRSDNKDDGATKRSRPAQTLHPQYPPPWPLPT